MRPLSVAALLAVGVVGAEWEECDKETCMCAGFCLEGLSDRSHSLLSADDSSRFLLSLCSELPKDAGQTPPASPPDGWQPGSQGCAGCDDDASECTVVRITTTENPGGQDSVACDGAGSIGGCAYPEPCGMSGRPSADGGLEIRYQFAAAEGSSWIRDDFILHISAGEAEEFSTVLRQQVDGEFQYSANLTAPAEDFTCLGPPPQGGCGPAPTTPADADASCTKADGALAPPGDALPCGSSCTFTCAAGYADPNVGRAKTFECGSDGNFTDHDLNCALLPPPPPPECSCGAAPPRPAHARTNCIAAHVRCGESCTFTCEDGYADPEVGRARTFECGSDGNFTDYELDCEAEPEPMPEPEPEHDLCQEAYKKAIQSALSGVCASPTACSADRPNSPCQQLITTMLENCKDQVYNATDDEAGKIITRSFDQQAVEALQLLGLSNCDFHEGYDGCNATCHVDQARLELGDCAKWFFTVNFQGFCEPNGVDNSEACRSSGPLGGCSAECMDRFFDFQDRCSGCSDPFVQSFLKKASGGWLVTPSINDDSCPHDELPCLGAATCMTGCENVTKRVLRTCCSTRSDECDGDCAGIEDAEQCLKKKGCTCDGAQETGNGDPSKCHQFDGGKIKCVAEDPWPSTCLKAGGCEDAVVSAALEVCPKIFYEQPRLFGLYTDCTEDRREGTQDLIDAYMRWLPDIPYNCKQSNGMPLGPGFYCDGNASNSSASYRACPSGDEQECPDGEVCEETADGEIECNPPPSPPSPPSPSPPSPQPFGPHFNKDTGQVRDRQQPSA